MAYQFLKNSLWLLLLVSLPSFGYFKPQFFQRNIPQEFRRFKPAVSARPAGFLEFFRNRQLKFRRSRGGLIDLFMEGTKPFALSGMPKVPKLLRVFNVPQGKSAEAYLENVVLEETSLSVPVAKAPEAYVWNLFRRRMNFKNGNTERYFPGRLVQSYQANGNLWVTFFPVQVDLHTGKILKVTSADIKVAYSDSPAQDLAADFVESPSLIVTSEKLKSAAELLKNYHERRLGVKTQIVTVEDINKTESMISDEKLPEGYKDPSERDNFIKPYDSGKQEGYNYELAKKISNYLQRKMGDASSLKYVTLLGDSQVVPPSY